MICENIAGPHCSGVVGPPGPAAAWGTIAGVIDNQADLIAKFTVDQLIIVRLATGNDATAVVGRTDLPFKTLSAAIDSANSNSEIKVFEIGTETVGTTAAIGVRIEMQTGAVLTIATGVTLFDNPQGGPQIYGSGRIVLQGTAKLIVGTDVNLSLDLNAYTGGVNLLDTYGIELTRGIHSIFIRSTFTQTANAVGGMIKITDGSVDIRLGGQVSPTSSLRATPMINLVTCKGNLETGWNQVSAVIGTSPLYDIGLAGIVTIRGGTINATNTAPFVRLSAPYAGASDPLLVIHGLVNQGTGVVVQAKAGDWAIDAGIDSAGSPVITAVKDAPGDPNFGLGVSGYVSSTAVGGAALRIGTATTVEINCKVYGNVELQDNTLVQFTGSAGIVGQVKMDGAGSAKVRGISAWMTTTALGSGVTVEALGIAPTINPSLF